jgi:putative membrane protein
LGKLAQSNGGSKAVKDYGRMLERDHQKAGKQITDLAKDKHVQLMHPPVENKKIEELRPLHGAAFDKRFLTMMVDEHTKTMEELQNVLPDVKDPQVRTSIEELLPILKHHRDTAQAILAQLRAS